MMTLGFVFNTEEGFLRSKGKSKFENFPLGSLIKSSQINGYTCLDSLNSLLNEFP